MIDRSPTLLDRKDDPVDLKAYGWSGGRTRDEEHAYRQWLWRNGESAVLPDMPSKALAMLARACPAQSFKTRNEWPRRTIRSGKTYFPCLAISPLKGCGSGYITLVVVSVEIPTEIDPYLLFEFHFMAWGSASSDDHRPGHYVVIACPSPYPECHSCMAHLVNFLVKPPILMHTRL